MVYKYNTLVSILSKSST